MKKLPILYSLALVALVLGLVIYYQPSSTKVKQNKTTASSHQVFKAKTVVHDFGRTELKTEPKRIVILNNLYGEILQPLGLIPVGASSRQPNSQEFSPIFQENYAKEGVVSIGWQGSPDLQTIADLKPDLILMTVHQEGLYQSLSEIAPTIGYRTNSDEDWNFHDTALKVAEIFGKKREMKNSLNNLDTKITSFSEKVRAKYGDQKLMYLRITDKEVRYYAYGHFGYLYDNYQFNRAYEFDPEKMYEVMTPEKLKEIDPDLLIVETDPSSLKGDQLKKTDIWKELKAVQNNKVIEADYATYVLGFGIVSQEAIMNQIADEWDIK